MGGLRTREPFAFLAMLLGTLSICGVPPFSGFFSKDAVVYDTLLAGHPVLYAVGIVTAGITAYYMFRMLFIAFFGTYRGEIDPSSLGIRHPELAGTSAGLIKHPRDEPSPHEAGAPAWLMSAPVAVLFIGTALAGFLTIGGTASPWHRLLEPVFGSTVAPVENGAPLSEGVSSGIVLIFVLIGIGLAFLRYGGVAAVRDSVARLREESIRMSPLLTNAFYFDAAIDALFVRPIRVLGVLFDRYVDPLVIDGAVREARFSASWLGHLFRSFQTGQIRAYALTIVFGAAAFIVYYTVVGTR